MQQELGGMAGVFFENLNACCVLKLEHRIEGIERESDKMGAWWNPAMEQQAQDRIHRLGQVRGCGGGNGERGFVQLSRDLPFFMSARHVRTCVLEATWSCAMF